ncbi:MAG: hypothetical protein QM739_13670 [Propionivibrio sp.]
MEGKNAGYSSDKRASGYMKHDAIWGKEGSVFAGIPSVMPSEFNGFVRCANQFGASLIHVHLDGAL